MGRHRAEETISRPGPVGTARGALVLAGARASRPRRFHAPRAGPRRGHERWHRRRWPAHGLDAHPEALGGRVSSAWRPAAALIVGRRRRRAARTYDQPRHAVDDQEPTGPGKDGTTVTLPTTAPGGCHQPDFAARLPSSPARRRIASGITSSQTVDRGSRLVAWCTAEDLPREDRVDPRELLAEEVQSARAGVDGQALVDRQLLRGDPRLPLPGERIAGGIRPLRLRCSTAEISFRPACGA